MAATLYDTIVIIIESYLGPAGRRFVDRMITFHLKKAPAEVAATDLPRLIEWINVSLALLTDDREMIEECTRRLIQLT